MQLGFYFDQTRCIGCNTCVIACKDWNMINPGPVRLRNPHLTEKGEAFPSENFFNLPYSCNHCENPACVPACGTGAITKRASDGVVIIDRTKCVDLGACITACPFSAPKQMSDKQEPDQDHSWQVKHPAIKCTFCWDRLAENKKPSCVAACPVRALDYGPMDTLRAAYPDAVQANSTDVVNFPDSTKGNDGSGLPYGDTKPSLLVKVKKTGGYVDTGTFKAELFS